MSAEETSMRRRFKTKPRHEGVAAAVTRAGAGDGPLPDLGQLHLERKITRALLAADSGLRGIEDVIRIVCKEQSWLSGALWLVDEPSAALKELTRWPTVRPGDEPRHAASCLPPPWLDDQPVWIGGLSADVLRSDQHSAWKPSFPGVLVPIRCGRRLLAVLALEGHADATPSREVMRILSALALPLGLFLERTHDVDQLRESERRATSTLALDAIGIAHVDGSGRFIYANPRLCEMLGYAEHELLARTVRDISHPDDLHVTDELRGKLRRGEIGSFKIEKRYLRKDGDSLWVALTVATRRNDTGQPVYDVSVVEDITARKLAEEQVQYLATHDGLTGLPNRAMFTQLMSLAIEGAKRRRCKIAVLFIDLDRFKTINDSLGHDAGDALLREMAARFRKCMRAGDVVARLGGDEFVVLLQDVSDPVHAATAARHLLSAALRPVEILRQECRITASIGICMHPEGDQDDAAALKNADLAMYAAKEEGKNTYHFYSPALRARTAGRFAIEAHLRHALEHNELSLHYQAKVHVDTGAITGVEALLRWNSPALGSVPPVQFIPVAEETGLIVPIGQWVLRTACAQCAEWLRSGLPPVRVCVNLSMRQLQDAGALIADIRACLADCGLSPHLLELELTESMIMHNAEHAVRVLTEIKALGVRLAIDDFGTGYSSLAQLKRFPIDTLKVDRSFIRETPTDPEDAEPHHRRRRRRDSRAEGIPARARLRRDARLLLQHPSAARRVRAAAAHTQCVTRRTVEPIKSWPGEATPGNECRSLGRKNHISKQVRENARSVYDFPLT
jgi:diguanylate cyclase (GGDEF)-like protein/PAS domain S-box-containing protein